MARPTDDLDLSQQTAGAALPPPDDAIAPCENCQVPLTGTYCAACGQSRLSPIVSVRAFTAHQLDDLASVDSRLVRTMRALFFRPGQLTSHESRFLPHAISRCRPSARPPMHLDVGVR